MRHTSITRTNKILKHNRIKQTIKDILIYISELISIIITILSLINMGKLDISENLYILFASIVFMTPGTDRAVEDEKILNIAIIASQLLIIALILYIIKALIYIIHM